jgi:hypothetical protein
MAVRKPLRTALTAARRAGLRVVEVREGGRHTEVLIAGGGKLRLHRGTKVDLNFNQMVADDVRRIARQQEGRP